MSAAPDPRRRTFASRRAIAPVACAVLAVIASACGSSSDGGSTTAAAPPAATTQVTGGSTTPMPMRKLLAGTTWQGMGITVAVMKPQTFEIFQGTSARMVRPAPHDSVHLMVMLLDASSGQAIPYASVWETIRSSSGTIVSDDRLWPMISRANGSHYGTNVALPHTGKYRIELRIGPPQAARHLEYAKVWLKPHRVTLSFRWKGKV